MKGYKTLIPIVLVVIFVLSIYSLYDTKASILNEYNGYLESAREARRQGIIVDANAYYNEALDLQESIDLYLELAEYHLECGNVKQAMKVGSMITEKYPKDVKGYEFMFDRYYPDKDYFQCFRIGDIITKRKLSSEKISSVLASLEYEYYFNGSFDEVGVFSEGRCPVMVENKWGFVSQGGTLTVSAKFKEVGAYSSDLAPVIDDNDSAYFIDKQGNKKFVLMDVKNVKKLGVIYSDVFPLYNGKTWGYYNKKREHVFGEYEEALTLGNGVAPVKKNGKWSLVNVKGEALTNKKYVDVAYDEKQVAYRNERLFVCENAKSKYQMIDAFGNVISKQTFEDVRVFNDTTYAAVKINGKWGFIDKAGKMKIEPKFDDARSFSSKYAAVKQGDKWGFINEEGKFVIEPTFTDVKDFNEYGCVFVKRGEDNWEMLKLYKYNH